MIEELEETGIGADERIRELAIRRSKFHTPTRYPDDGIAASLRTREEAIESLEWVEEVLRVG